MSRVTKEFNIYKRDDVIGNTPSLSLTRSLGSKAVTSVTSDRRTDKFIDVWHSQTTFFHVSILEPIYIKPEMQSTLSIMCRYCVARWTNGTRPVSKPFGDLERQSVSQHTAPMISRSHWWCSGVSSGTQTHSCTMTNTLQSTHALSFLRWGRILTINFESTYRDQTMIRRKSIKILKGIMKFKHELDFTRRRDDRHISDLLTLRSLAWHESYDEELHQRWGRVESCGRQALSVESGERLSTAGVHVTQTIFE